MRLTALFHRIRFKARSLKTRPMIPFDWRSSILRAQNTSEVGRQLGLSSSQPASPPTSRYLGGAQAHGFPSLAVLLLRIHSSLQTRSRLIGVSCGSVSAVNHLKGKAIMDARKKHLMAVLLFIGFVFAGLVTLGGCKKEEPAPADTNQAAHDHGEGEHTH